MKKRGNQRFVFGILRLLAGPFVKITMGFRCGKRQKITAPSLIIANHNTDIDPALVALGVSGQMYFVSSEHALRKGFGSKLIKRLFDPIVINKTKSDAYAAKEILRKLKSGRSVCLFAEGNRSYTGLTGPIRFSTAKLARAGGAALVTYRIEGGYFTRPRWSNSKRKGRMRGGVVGNYSPDQLAAMTDEEIFALIERDIHEDAYQRQSENPVRYRGKKLAENIETALYMCPECGGIGTIHSDGNLFSCGCGLRARYTNMGYITDRRKVRKKDKADYKPLEFDTVTGWCKWQSERLREIIAESMAKGDERPFFQDEEQRLYRVRPAEGSDLVGEGPMWISSKELGCAGMTFPLDNITRLAIVDQMTLLFGLRDGAEYEVLSDRPRSTLKYVEAFDIISEINQNNKKEG